MDAAPAPQSQARPAAWLALRGRGWVPPFLVVLVVLAATWAIFVHAAAAVVPFDDAFISLRYAENLAAGHGLVYNEGERVFGSSSPLYVLWLTVLRLVVPGDLATAALRVNAVAFVAAALAAGLLVRQLTGRPLLGAVTAACLLVDPVLLAISIGVMETFWFLALVLAGLLVLSSDPPRPRLFGLLTGTAILVRPEGVLLALLGLAALPRRPATLLRAAAAAAVPLAAWALFATLYFGSPIPHSLVAKSTPIYLLPSDFTLVQLADNLDSWLTAHRLVEAAAVRRAAVVTLLAVAAAAVVALPAARRRRAWLPPLLLLGLAAVYAIANTHYFEWYWPPVDALAAVSLVVGLAAIEAAGHERLIARGRRRSATATRTVAAAILAGWMLALATSPVRYDGVSSAGPMSFVRESPARRRVLAYRAAGESLARLVAPGETVAAPEFGALGSTFRGRILDPCGLVSPEALPFLPIPREEQPAIGAGSISSGFVEATRPDWIVALPLFTSPRLLRAPWFPQRYRVAGVMPLPFVVWGNRELVIYRRRE